MAIVSAAVFGLILLSSLLDHLRAQNRAAILIEPTKLEQRLKEHSLPCPVGAAIQVE